MYLTDFYTYLNSLRKEEYPVAGYVFRPGDDGNPTLGALLPIYSLSDPSWEYLPFSGYVKAVDDAAAEDPESLTGHYKYMKDYSISNLNELYKRKPCLRVEDINLDVAEALYNAMYRPDKWSDLEPYERSQFLAKLAETVDKTNVMDKNLKAEVKAKQIAAKNAANSVSVIQDLIRSAIPSIVNHFAGAPMFLESNSFNQWKFSFKG